VEECSGRYTERLRQLQLAAKERETLGRERLEELLRCLGHRAGLLYLLRRKNEAERTRERIASLTPPADSEITTVVEAG